MNSEASECKESGLLVPVIDQNLCEGKADCVRVCPYSVFELGRLDESERAGLSRRGRVKAFFHGYRQAFVTRPEACHACGLCARACPEKAIRLQRAG
jgi:NAD-dependent dihydropyrimidine dehydrogenase PreA subunit